MIAEEVKVFYHCTLESNVDNILAEGLKPGADGCVYLTATPSDSVKFLLIRGVPLQDIAIIGIPRTVLDETKLDISADHSINFFGCEAYTYKDTIQISGKSLSKIARKGDN